MTAQIPNFDIEEPDGEEMKAFADRIAKHRNSECQAASYVFLVDAEWIDADGDFCHEIVAAEANPHTHAKASPTTTSAHHARTKTSPA